MAEVDCTVLIPAFRHATTIGEAVASVLAQTAIDRCRVIVSDDASPDETQAVARKAVGGRAGVEVRRNRSNLGVMGHYRELIERVETPYLAILEGDDVWISPRKLELQLDFLERHPAAGMCFCGYLVSDEETGATRPAPHWDNGRYRFVNAIDLLYYNAVATFSTCVYRTSALKAVFDRAARAGSYDWLCTLLIALEGKVGFVPGQMTLYRLHPGGTWTALSRDERHALMRRVLGSLYGGAGAGITAFLDDAVALWS